MKKSKTKKRDLMGVFAHRQWQRSDYVFSPGMGLDEAMRILNRLMRVRK